jgi:rfaE bifunctional protein kinase chain/domain
MCSALDILSSRKILVIGDIMLDRYVRGDVNRISPEAPVPVLRVTEESSLLGGAANVANNLASMGVDTHVMAVIGSDTGGSHLTELMEARGIDTQLINASPLRSTTIKTRIVAGQQQIVRVDREDIQPMQDSETDQLLENLEKHWCNYDACILSDYGKGMLSPEFLDGIRALQKAKPRIVAVDPKHRDFSRYQGFSICTPNRMEAETALGTEFTSKEILVKKGHELRESLGIEALLITLGSQGMVLFTDQPPLWVNTEAREVFDVTGAGDTVISILATGLCLGLDYAKAAKLANYGAGLVVAKLGAATLDRKDLQWIYSQLD